MEELQEFMDKHRHWANVTFGAGRKPSAPIHHLAKEVKELIEAIEIPDPIDYEAYQKKRKDLKFEFADCMILLLHGASVNNLSASELFHYVEKKFEMAKKRKWGPLDENGVSQHIK